MPPMKARGWRSLRELYMPGNNDALFANNMDAIAAVNNHDAGSNQAMEAAYSRVPKRKSSESTQLPVSFTLAYTEM